MFLLSFVVAIVHFFGGGGCLLLDSLKSSFENTTYKPIKDVIGVFMKMGASPTASPFDFWSFLFSVVRMEPRALLKLSSCCLLSHSTNL